MAEETVLGGVIAFMGRLGIYDVVLPFLLVFTIMYAIFEKSKVLGTEKYDGEEIPRKNLNAMAAFTISFLVVASSKLVEIITTISAKAVVLMMLGVFFLVLLGTFYGNGEDVKLEGGWRTAMIWVMFVGMAIIFLDTITFASGDSILEWAWGFVLSAWTSAAAASVIFILLLIGFMAYITGSNGKPADDKPSDEGGD